MVRWLSYMASRLLLRLLLAPFTRTHVLGRETTRAPGPLIIAANHISHFDPPLLGVAAYGKIDWMGMLELFEMPVLGAWCRAVDVFPVDRARADRRAVRAALERLRLGRRVGMFPEGGIRDGAESVLGGAMPRAGVGALAQMSGAPVLPAVIIGSDRLYAPRAWLPWRQTPIWIAFGKPMACAGPSKQDRQDFEKAVAETMRALAAEARAKFRLTDEDFPQPPRRRKGRE